MAVKFGFIATGDRLFFFIQSVLIDLKARIVGQGPQGDMMFLAARKVVQGKGEDPGTHHPQIGLNAGLEQDRRFGRAFRRICSTRGREVKRSITASGSRLSATRSISLTISLRRRRLPAISARRVWG